MRSSRSQNLKISPNRRSHLHRSDKSLIWAAWLAKRSPNDTKALQQVTQLSPRSQKCSQMSSPIHPKSHSAVNISQVSERCSKPMRIYEINCGSIKNALKASNLRVRGRRQRRLPFNPPHVVKRQQGVLNSATSPFKARSRSLPLPPLAPPLPPTLAPLPSGTEARRLFFRV